MRKGAKLPPLSDPHRLFAYKDALGNCECEGYVEFELNQQAYEWIKRELDNISLDDISRAMFKFVADGGQIDEVTENRPGWCDDYEFHHDIRLTIQDKQVYIETRLNYRVPVVPDASSILVVNIHAV